MYNVSVIVSQAGALGRMDWIRELILYVKARKKEVDRGESAHVNQFGSQLHPRYCLKGEGVSVSVQVAGGTAGKNALVITFAEIMKVLAFVAVLASVVIITACVAPMVMNFTFSFVT